jgi:hypothetical protein
LLNTQLVCFVKFDDNDIGRVDRNRLFFVIGLTGLGTFDVKASFFGINTDYWARQWVSSTLSTVPLSTVGEIATSYTDCVSDANSDRTDTIES